MATMQSSQLSSNNETSPAVADTGDTKTESPSEKVSQDASPTGEKELYTTSSQAQVEGSPQGAVKDCVLKMLDELDERVEKLRSNAMKLENERDDALSSLDTLYNAQIVYELEGIDLDEVTRYIERVGRRCMAVQVEIRTERSPVQLEALSKVNILIDNLIRDLKKDIHESRRRCIAYINTCSEQVVSDEIPDTDSTFENAVLECSIEDQKRIKKRLTGLHSYFSSFDAATSFEVEDIKMQVAIDRSLQP